MSPYLLRRTLEDPGWFAKIFGREPKSNAFTKIWNLVATTRISDIRPEDVESILRAHNVERGAIKTEALSLYAAVLQAVCTDDVLSDEEITELQRLRSLFGFTDTEVSDITSRAYQRRVAASLKDQDYSDNEQARMAALATRLRLPADIATAALKGEAEALLEKVLKEKTTDQRLSRDEEAELRALAERLGGSSLTLTGATVDRYRLYWRIDQGDLPRLDVPVNLRSGEDCHFYAASVTHLERQTVTRAIAYTGPTGRIRLAKGVYWRIGAIVPAPITDEVLTPLDTGTLYITNRRLLFDGSKKSTTIHLGKIINFTSYRDGIAVEKESGKDQVFRVDTDIELMSIILGAALNRLN